MTHERWQQVHAVFDAAVELPPAERAPLLDARCGPDEALRAEVASLLAAYDGDPDFLEEPVGAVCDALDEPGRADDPPEAQRIGPYRVIRRIGEGGMSTIYLAVRDDAFRRRVALKLIKRGMDTADLLRRFRRERQILAALDHPDIARLYDGGMTDEGRPYFVMEVVEDGVPIVRYCDDQRLGVPTRLRLFRRVASAVHYAHQNLVIHCDLKPSNILVSADGQPRLLDFGIAKLLRPDASGRFDSGAAMPETRTGLRLMTPEYASPEQLRGDAVTTASDVYALGVVLYELLAGSRPFDAHRRTHDECAALAETLPERPSSRVRRTDLALAPTAADRARVLRGDLDTIVLKAMHPDPQRRYASAEALGEDLGRYLNGLPVAARPDTLRYRAGKFVRRHRLPVAAAAAAFVLALGFGAVMAAQAARIADQADALAAERDRAQQEAAKAAQASAFLADLFEAADPAAQQGGALTARDLLDRGSARLQRDFAEQPGVRAELMDVLARTYANLGHYPDALALADAAHEARLAAYGPEHPEAARGLCRRGEAQLLNGQFADAEASFREALALQRRALPPIHAETARTLTALTRVFRIRDRFQEAEAFGREAVAVYRALRLDERPEMADALFWLAQVVEHRDRPEAEALLQETVALRRDVLGADHPELGWALASLGDVKLRRGALAEAEAHIREALALMRRAYGEEHPDVSRVLMSLARLHTRRGERHAAAAVYERAATIRERTLGSDHPSSLRAVQQLAAARRGLDETGPE